VKITVERCDEFLVAVPQIAYSGSQKVDDKEKILWMRFERSDINGKNNLYYTV
jgi:hypothetical protein